MLVVADEAARRVGDNVVFPVPLSPKKRATSSASCGFTFAEQCIDSTPSSGRR